MGVVMVSRVIGNCTPKQILEIRKEKATEALKAASAEAPKNSPALDLSRLVQGGTTRASASDRLNALDLNNPDQRLLGQALNAFLDNLNFDEINRWVHLEGYGASPIYEHLADIPMLRDRLKAGQKATKGEAPLLTRQQALAFDFLVFNRSLSAHEVKEVFSGQPDLLKALQGFGIVTSYNKNGQTHYRLNDLSLASHRLTDGQVLYAFIDLPKELRPGRRGQDNAQLSSTSYTLLEELEKDYQKGNSRSGLVADFGSGSGFLSMALLKMNPKIKKVYGVEIDPRAMQLSRLNALMNGEAQRFEVVDNQDLKNLDVALKGKPLDFAISNPPFNVDPGGVIAKVGTFGTGGTYGLDVTKIFLGQAMRNLREGGEIKLYSVLSADTDIVADGMIERPELNSLHLSQEVQDMAVQRQIPFGVTLVFNPVPVNMYWENGDGMATVITYLQLNPDWRKHGSGRFDVKDDRPIRWQDKKFNENKQLLEKNGISSEAPFIWSAVKEKTAKGIQIRLPYGSDELPSKVQRHNALFTLTKWELRNSQICNDEKKGK